MGRSGRSLYNRNKKMIKKHHDWEYLNLVNQILNEGTPKGDRTGTGTTSLFAQQMRFDLTDMSIPMLTTKKMFVKGIIHELLWFLAGDTNIKYLNDHNVRIWNEWADENGDLGPVYGKQWRDWDGVDQIADVIQQLRNNPNDRRIIVSAWNVPQIPEMGLPPCHCLFQFWSDGRGHLKCHLYQRSCDVGLGVPFNIVQYSILTHMIAHVTNHEAVEFVWTGGDTHIYNNHQTQLGEQILRDPMPSPTLWLDPTITEIDDFVFDSIRIIDYNSHPSIKMDVSI